MAQAPDRKAGKQLRLPLLCASAALMLGLPTAGLAVVGFDVAPSTSSGSAFDLFTPASVDPELAARVADKARERGIRFTPTGTENDGLDRTVTVAVRIDNESAQAISVRTGLESVPGVGRGLDAVRASRFNLGTARGYQSFARPSEPAPASGQISLPDNVRDLRVPDLAEFEPSRSSREDEPSRLQPRIDRVDDRLPASDTNPLEPLDNQTIDVGGSFRLSPNLDVTAGVRYSQDRDRLAPLTDSVQDSQAVYVGTQIRF